MNAVYRVQMTESEAGWGQRPDGFIYGATKQDIQEALKRIAAAGSYDSYSFPSSEIVLVEVKQELYDSLHSKTEGSTIWTPRNKHEDDLS